jgi:ATP synthase protein I
MIGTHERRMVRGAVLAALAAAAATTAVAWVVAGPAGAVGALAGAGVAIAFFGVTFLVVGAAARVSDQLMLPAALGAYVLKLAGLGLLFVTLRHAAALNRTAFALSAVIGTCAFLGAELAIAARARIPYVDEPRGSAAE